MKAIQIFYCSAQEDMALRDELDKHLEVMKREGKLITGSDREIQPGTVWEQEIVARLNAADIILLLISPDFLHSNYYWSPEMQQILERHREGKTRLIPIILRPVDWEGTPISELNVLPTDKKPITKWRNRDDAFRDIAKSIRKMAETLLFQRWKEEGLSQYKAKQYVRSLEAFVQALRLNPHDAVTYRHKGDILLALKRYQEAVEAFEQAIRLDPLEPLATLGKGDALGSLKRYEEALTSFEQAAGFLQADTTPAQKKLELLIEAKKEELLASIDLSEIEERCIKELNAYRQGEKDVDRYCLELFRRAILKQDQVALQILQGIFHDLVLHWFRRNPYRAVALQFDSEENYIALTFERYWLTASNQSGQFRSLTTTLSYLHIALSNSIMDALRTFSRAKEIPLSELSLEDEPIDISILEESDELNDLWESIRRVAHNERERLLAYLLFVCDLKPTDIVRYGPQEFSNIKEVYRLQHILKDRLARDMDGSRSI